MQMHKKIFLLSMFHAWVGNMVVDNVECRLNSLTTLSEQL
jgi:tyrosyl-tRNA synthetase